MKCECSETHSPCKVDSLTFIANASEDIRICKMNRGTFDKILLK